MHSLFANSLSFCGNDSGIRIKISIDLSIAHNLFHESKLQKLSHKKFIYLLNDIATSKLLHTPKSSSDFWNTIDVCIISIQYFCCCWSFRYYTNTIIPFLFVENNLKAWNFILEMGLPYRKKLTVELDGENTLIYNNMHVDITRRK